jgi:hypothetical protein
LNSARGKTGFLFLSFPPRNAWGGKASTKWEPGWGAPSIEKIQNENDFLNPHPDARCTRIDLESELARLGPLKGEGEESIMARSQTSGGLWV